MFKVNNKDARMTALMSLWFHCYFRTYFTPFSTVSIVEFEQVNVFRVHKSSHALVGFVFQLKKKKKGQEIHGR